MARISWEGKEYGSFVSRLTSSMDTSCIHVNDEIIGNNFGE